MGAGGSHFCDIMNRRLQLIIMLQFYYMQYHVIENFTLKGFGCTVFFLQFISLHEQLWNVTSILYIWYHIDQQIVVSILNTNNPELVL